MSLKFRDFVPHSVPVQKSMLGISYTGANSATLESAAEEAGTWIDTHQIQVVSLETVILSAGSGFGDQSTSAARSLGESSFVHQFLRVWYKAN